MTKIFIAIIISVFMASFSFAGEIEVTSLVDIQGQSDTGLLLNIEPGQSAKYYPDGKMPSQILAFWVKFQGQEILFDAGLRDGHIVSRLAEKGVAPEKISTILITHLHPDHFGGLTDDEGRASFPKADVFVSKPEYDYWVNELKNENVINALKLYSVHTFQFGDEVVPGVRAVDTSGHTPGHVAYLVEAGGEKLIIAGDIMHFPEIQLPHPDVAVKYDVDPVKAVQSRKFLLDYAAWKNIPIAGMHITPPGIISVKKSGDGYEKY